MHIHTLYFWIALFSMLALTSWATAWGKRRGTCQCTRTPDSTEGDLHISPKDVR